MYKIIDKLPDNVKDEDVETINMKYDNDYYPFLMELRKIGPDSNEIEKRIKKNFLNVPKIEDTYDIIRVSESDLNIEGCFYFFDPNKKFKIDFLYDVTNNRYLKIKYQKI